MAKSKKAKRKKIPVLCEECGEGKSLKKSIYRIVDRAGFRGKVFCGLSCIDDHLARELHGWIAVSETFRTSSLKRKQLLHRVRIERSDKANLYKE